MKESPLLCSAEMVRAILEGRKTQTRRPMKPQPVHRAIKSDGIWYDADCIHPGKPMRCPFSQPRLWVRETFQFVHQSPDGQRRTFNSYAPFAITSTSWIEYWATPKDNEPPPTWKPSIHMPRWASRITLEVVNVRVERVQEMTDSDALAEGVTDHGRGLRKPAFANLWDAIYAKDYSWDKNPFVWVVEFKRI